MVAIPKDLKQEGIQAYLDGLSQQQRYLMFEQMASFVLQLTNPDLAANIEVNGLTSQYRDGDELGTYGNVLGLALEKDGFGSLSKVSDQSVNDFLGKALTSYVTGTPVEMVNGRPPVNVQREIYDHIKAVYSKIEKVGSQNEGIVFEDGKELFDFLKGGGYLNVDKTAADFFDEGNSWRPDITADWRQLSVGNRSLLVTAYNEFNADMQGRLSPVQSLQDKSLQDKSLQDKSLQDKSLQDKSLQDKSLQDKSLQDKSLQDKSLQDKSLQDKSLQDKSLQDKSLQDKSLQDKSLQDKSLQDKSLQDKSLQDKSLQDKSLQDKSLQDKSQSGQEPERPRREAPKPPKQERLEEVHLSEIVDGRGYWNDKKGVNGGDGFTDRDAIKEALEAARKYGLDTDAICQIEKHFGDKSNPAVIVQTKYAIEALQAYNTDLAMALRGDGVISRDEHKGALSKVFDVLAQPGSFVIDHKGQADDLLRFDKAERDRMSRYTIRGEEMIRDQNDKISPTIPTDGGAGGMKV